MQQFKGKGTDLRALLGKIDGDLQSSGFTVQMLAPSPYGTVIQAKKGGFLQERVGNEVAHLHRAGSSAQRQRPSE